MFKPRPYQVPAQEACDNVLLTPKNRKSIIVQPTGAGKSWLTAHAATELSSRGLPVLVLQPSSELLKQNFEKFIYMGGRATIKSSSMKVKQKDNKLYTSIDGKLIRCDEISNVTYATVGSVMKDIQAFKDMKLKHVIIDEVHLMTKQGSRIRKLLKDIKATNVLGLTATPVYLKSGIDGARLVMINRSQYTVFPDIAHVTQIHELVKENYWSKLKYRVVDTDESSLQYNSSGSDYTVVSQRKYFDSNKLNYRIKEEISNLRADGRKSILVFVPTIHEANELMRIVPDSAVVHSKTDTKTRNYVVEAFKNLEIPVVFNVNVLATGFDHPQLDAVITARPTTSVAIYYQQIGRLVRIHERKKNGFVTDFSGNVKKFGRVEELTFEEVPMYGWGMFGTGDILLSDIPLIVEDRPTKKELEDGKKAEREAKVREITDLYNNEDVSVKLWFGKWKGRTVAWLNENEKDYLKWIYDNFDFSSEKSRALRADIERHFGIVADSGSIKPEDRF